MVGDPPVRLGELVGARYRLTDRIGEGGMGVVYGAIDEQLHRPIAIKFVSPAFHRDADRLARFKNEARALSALNHPHIITIFEVGEAGGTPFIAMELVDGRTLRDHLRSGPLPVREALDVALQVARALVAAHGKGIVHRDIKPENVMIRRDGYVKVLDFGLAGLRPTPEPGVTAVTAGSFETVAAAAVGTPAYMSPEQIGGQPIDPRSDIFSLGVLLCEAATGANPFLRPSVLETLGAIEGTPDSGAATMTNLPPELGVIARRALQKDPDGRYQTAADFAEAVQRLLARLGRPAESAAPARSRRRYAAAAVLALLLVLAAGAAATTYRRSERRHWAREQATPEIARLAGADRAAAAFPLIQTAEQYLPGDADLAAAVSRATMTASVDSSPPGADVDVEDYLAPDEGWLRLGVTPLEHTRIPSGYLRWKVSKAGTGEVIAAPPSSESMHFNLDAAAKAPEGMVPVEGGAWIDSLAFLGWLGPYDLPPFFIDRFEVTNRQFQEFVDNGGYATREYWKQPLVRDGRTLPWSEAMDLFRDATGRPGPATWEGGHYPDGKGDFPVSGVSWFEAAAYAESVGKSLPVLAQSVKVEPWSLDHYLVQLSNMSATPARAGAFQGLGAYGTYDTVGNVREWSWNAAGNSLRYILGRQATAYGPEALSPFDRSPLNGFRCVRNEGPVPAAAAAPRVLLRRDFSKAVPADDKVFRIYRNMYAYDKRPLDASVDTLPQATEDWTTQRIAFDTAYGERMWAFLFLPRNVRPPYQAVVFFPSARTNFIPSSDALGDLTFMDFVVKSGRAVIYPIYKNLYERRSASPILPGPTLVREITVDWSKDLGRSIDYLETRPDIDVSRLGYLGVSQGSAYGVILAALEDRLKAVVLLDGGFFQQEDPVAGMDQVDFAPRLTRPVLMINGRYDATFPVDSAQEPLFRLLGTPEADKRRVVFDTPHDVRLKRADLVREVLAWYDKYLGRVNGP